MSPLRKSTQQSVSKSSKVTQPQDFHRTGPLEEILTPSPLFPTDDLENLGFSEAGEAGGSSESFDTVVVEGSTGDANADESSEVLEAINVDSDPDDGLDPTDLNTGESAGEDLDDPIVVITELDDEDLDDLDGNEIEATITDDSEISEVVEAADVTETLGKVDPVETIETEDTSEAAVTAADVTSKVTEDTDTDSEVGSDGDLELGVESKTDADLNEDARPVETQTESNVTTGEALGADLKVEVTEESDPNAVAAGDDASIVDLTNEPLDGDSVSDVIDGEASAEDEDADTDEEFEEILEEIVKSAGFTLDLSVIDAGIFTVGSDGLVGIDFLYDGGAYKGQLAIFSLEGLDGREFESFDDFIAETVDRASSNSDRGYLVINDKTEGAKFASAENSGEYRGVKLFAMKAGDTFAVMLVPNSTLAAAADGESTSVMVRPLYSLSTANPDDELHVAQIADVTGDGSTFVLEDKSTENKTDRDYNDIVFQVRGAKGQAEYVGNVVEGNFFETDMGKAIRAYADPYVTPESEPIAVDDSGELVDETISDDSDVETNEADLNNSDLSELIDLDKGNESEIVDDVQQVLDATGSDESESELLPEWLFEPRDTVFAVPDIPAAPIANQPLIGIIDTGFAVNNPDINYENITLGTDFVDGDANPLLTEGEGSEHGTHVLGIIAAQQDNGEGIDGINDDAPIWLGRAIGSGKWADSLVEFVNHAIESEQPNAVVNLSLDLTQIDANGNVTTRYELTPSERAAIEYARQNNVLLVVGAGNDGGVMSALGQASQEFDNIITVGAAERVGEEFAAAKAFDRVGYSSYGQGLNIVAPGGTVENPELSLTGDGVGVMAGTSVATAKVTGTISQVWAANPQLSYRQVIEIVKDTATDLGGAGYDGETGAGLLNQAAAVLLAKVTLPEVHVAPSSVIPDSWSGEGSYVAGERAVATPFNGKYYEWKSYKIVSGDTLGAIAQRTMGNGSAPYYNFIAQKNGIANPNLISVGQTIQVPYEVAPPVVTQPQVGRGSRSPQIFQAAYNKINGTSQGLKPQGDSYRWGNGWTQKFLDKNGSEMLLMLEDGASEAFWMWHGNLGEYKQMGGATGHLGYPRSNEMRMPNKPMGHIYQVFATENGKSRIHFSLKTGSIATWGSIGRQYTDLGGAYHWLGMPTRREYAYGNDTIFSDFEGGKIAHQKSTGKVEVLKPGETASWLKSTPQPQPTPTPVPAPTVNQLATPGKETAYVVKAGDTLWSIAQRYLGQGNRWTEIRQTPNGSTFTTAEAAHLRIGQTVYIPLAYEVGTGTPVSPTQGTDFNLSKVVNSTPSSIRQYAKTSIPLILKEAKAVGITDLGQLAYILATSEHESLAGRWMEELSSGAQYEGRRDLGNVQPGDGVRFKGRGYVQITGRNNYTNWSQRLGIDLVANPAKASDPAIAAKIIARGMRDGSFTGVGLNNYINGSKRDFYNARRIVNGTDRAADIAKIAERYYAVLMGAQQGVNQPVINPNPNPIPTTNISLKPVSQNLNFSRGQTWETNGYKFTFQSDGNLVLYSPTGKVLWATGSEIHGANRFSVQTDGNVVLYKDNIPLWATNTAGNPGAKFVIQADGNLVVYSATGKPIFNTGTHLGKEVTRTASVNWIRDRNLQRFPDLHFSTIQSVATSKALDAGGSNGGVYPHSSLNPANNYHQWGFHKVGDQYMIISKATGLALDGGGGQNSSLPYTHLDPNANNPYQLWSVTKNGSGYQIVNKATGRALDAGGSNGNSIYMYPNPIQGNSYHQWKINLPPTVEEILSRFPGLSFSTVQSVATGKALDSGGANNSVYPYPSVNPANAHHQWGFYPVGDHYMLINKANGKALDGGGKNGELPYGYPNPQPTNNPYQLWKVTQNGSGYQIVNKATGRALDAGGSNGNSLYMYPNPINGNSYHQWNLNLPHSGTGELPLHSNPTEANPLRGFSHPLGGKGTLTQGWKTAFSHKGNSAYAMDFDHYFGAPVYAMRSGKIISVVESYEDNGRNDSSLANKANYVFIEHDNGYVSRYLHLKKNSVPVQVGDYVNAGQKIGEQGHSGWSTASHLHVAVHKGSISVPFTIPGVNPY